MSVCAPLRIFAPIYLFDLFITDFHTNAYGFGPTVSYDHTI